VNLENVFSIVVFDVNINVQFCKSLHFKFLPFVLVFVLTDMLSSPHRNKK